MNRKSQALRMASEGPRWWVILEMPADTDQKTGPLTVCLPLPKDQAKGGCYGWNVCVHTESHVEAPNPMK